jgi:hypothetical protein
MKVFVGVDPHKLSVTIEAVDKQERVLATGRFATDNAGYRAMRKHVASWPERTWAVEGSNGAGRSLAQRLLADGEHVVDVPAKLSARARLLDTGHNRKTDAHCTGDGGSAWSDPPGYYEQPAPGPRSFLDKRIAPAEHRLAVPDPRISVLTARRQRHAPPPPAHEAPRRPTPHSGRAPHPAT